MLLLGLAFLFLCGSDASERPQICGAGEYIAITVFPPCSRTERAIISPDLSPPNAQRNTSSALECSTTRCKVTALYVMVLMFYYIYRSATELFQFSHRTTVSQQSLQINICIWSMQLKHKQTILTAFQEKHDMLQCSKRKMQQTK